MTDPQPPTPPTPPSPPADPPTPLPDNPPAPPNADAAWKAEKEALEARIAELTKNDKGSKELIAQLSAILDPNAKPDPDKLASQLQERDQTLKQRTLELAIVRHAGEAAEQLLDSRSFMDKASELDVSEPNLSDKVKELVKKHAPVAKPPAKSGGADLNGGGNNNGKQQWTNDDLERNKDNPAAIMEAQTNGLLDTILGRVS